MPYVPTSGCYFPIIYLITSNPLNRSLLLRLLVLGEAWKGLLLHSFFLSIRDVANVLFFFFFLEDETSKVAQFRANRQSFYASRDFIIAAGYTRRDRMAVDESWLCDVEDHW